MECDTVTIQLRQSTAPYNIVSESKSVLQTNGQIRFSGNASLGQSYYIVLIHRNTVQSWSANPVTITENTFYDFTSDATQAYGANQIEVEPNTWALYSGDIEPDENVDLLDLGDLESDITNFSFGYVATDLNGDGNVDLLDSPVIEPNISNFIFSFHP